MISSLGGGGAEKVLIDILHNLDKEKYDITVCTIFDNGIYKDALPEYVKYATIIKRDWSILYSIFWRMLKWLPRSWMRKWFIKGEYDVEIAFLEGLSTLLISKSTCKNKIAWVHTDLIDNNHITPYHHGDKDILKTYKQYNKVVFVSNRALSQFEKRFGKIDTAEVIYNLIDKNTISKKCLEFEVPKKPDVPVVCTVGRLIPVKGYMRLLEAHKRLINEGIYHNLWFLGVGDDKEKMEEYVKQNGLEDTVTFWGFQRNPYPYVYSADIYTCTSFAEGYPLSVAEALSLNKPIVATNCTGPTEILHNGDFGLLVDNSEDGIFNGLRDVLTAPELLEQIKKKAAEGAECIDPRTVIAQIEQLF